MSTDKELFQFASTLEEAAATNIPDPTHVFMRQTQSYAIVSQHKSPIQFSFDVTSDK